MSAHFLEHHDRELLADVLEQLKELRGELRRLRSRPVVARLSDAEREEIAYLVVERLEERLNHREPAKEPAPATQRRSVKLRRS